MKALIFVLFAFLLPSCSLFEPVTDPVTTRTERLVEGYTPSGTADLVIRGGYTPSVINVDTIFVSPTLYHGSIYQVVSPESSVTVIEVNITKSIVAGYSYDGDGRSTEFILSCTLSPWNRDNEQVYDTVFGPLRIVTDPIIFLPYRGRISIGGREWMIK